MAKLKKGNESVASFRSKPKKKRKGIHAKSKSSNNKSSKNYKKLYIGQG